MVIAALLGPCPEAASLDAQFAAIAEGWGEARYATAGDDQQLIALHLLEVQTTALARACPQDPRTGVYLGVIYASQADASNWYDALRLADQAHTLLSTVESASLDTASRIDLECMLGVLFAQAPPTPISFGDARRAQHFEQALRLDPRGLETNLFYADFLIRQHRFSDARRALTLALAAPVRPGREVGDQGMQREAAELMAQARRNEAGAH